ncbi:MAG TPA: hypothetical protein VLX68_09550 [Chitinivibrionales bacterium]|nr:hypothetical protein [Chitinivibrionales bacterium]
MHPRIMMKSIIAVCIFCSLLFAKEMVLTTLDGVKIVLKEDNTWVLQSGKAPSFERDFTVPVNGGKYVLIAMDGTWGFVEKELVHQEDQVRADSIVGNGHSVNKDVMAANAEAQKQALSQVTTKMRNALAKLKIDQKLLGDCIKRAEKDVTKKEDFKQGLGWDVSIRMFVDRGSILAVADCAMAKEDEAADSTKKAAGGKKKKAAK